MKFVSLATAAALAFAFPTLAQVTKNITYDTKYDNPTYPLTNVACSDGVNGLVTKGYTTLGSLPIFPFVGGADTVTGWNSTACGTCYEITYHSTTVPFLAVDYAPDGWFIVSEATMDALGMLGVGILGRPEVTSTQLDPSVCGMN